MRKKIAIFEDSNGYGGSVLALQENIRDLSNEQSFEFVIVHSLDDSRFEVFKHFKHCTTLFNSTKKIQFSNQLINKVYKRLNFDLAFQIYRTSKLLSKYNPQLVYTNNDLECNLHAIISARLLNIPILTHERDCPSLWSRTTKLFYPIIPQVIAISDATKLAIVKQGYPENKILKISDGIDIQRLINYSKKSTNTAIKRKYNIPENKKIILMIGMITEWKGQHIVLKAIKELKSKRSDLHFIFVGEEPSIKTSQYKQTLDSYISEHNLHSMVSMLGFCKRETVAGLIKLSDLVIHSSIKPEPFGRTIVESMALGKVIIATNIGGPCEIIQNDITGFLIDPKKPLLLAQKIASIIDQPALLERIGEKAKMHVKEKYDSKIVANKIRKQLKK